MTVLFTLLLVALGILWVWMLIDSFRRTEFPTPIGNEATTRWFWRLALLLVNPITVLAYALLVKWRIRALGTATLHRALSVEWAPMGITCCVIAPGATDTPGLRRYPAADHVRKVGIRAANLGRLLQAREVAWLFLTMASPWAAGVNGHRPPSSSMRSAGKRA